MADERHRSPITRKGYRKGKPARNKGRKLPAEVLNADELERVMATFDRSTKRGVRNAAMAALMARAGLKVGQVLAMQRWHYEYGAHVITVPIGSGKSAREEKIPIGAVTRELLEAWWNVRKQLNMSRMATPSTPSQLASHSVTDSTSSQQRT
jgi:site-specific recombinase XerC